MIDPDWLPYLQGYGALGAVTCVAFICFAVPRATKSSALLQAISPPPPPKQPLISRVLKNVFSKMCAVAIMVSLWPLVWTAAAFMLYEKIVEKNRRKNAVFCVKRKHLKELTEIHTVEKNNLIHDPLNSVPNLPFGHLNSVWSQFLARQPQGAQLWSFECSWLGPLGNPELRTGYVWLLDKTIHHWALLDSKRLDANGDAQMTDR